MPHIGAALRERAGTVTDRIVERWRKRESPPADARLVEDSIRRIATAGTLALADYLMTGETVSDQLAEQWDLAGEAPLFGSITLSEVTKLYLVWRETCIAVVRDDGHASGWTPADVDRAVEAVQQGSDASLVRMAQRFETTRQQLEAQLAENQARLEYQALHDPLTGLANRVLLLDRLDHAVRGMTRREARPAVLFLDLDHFKSVNDVSGHSAGDQLLVEVAFLLQQIVRPNDTIARFGGDEFVVLCEDLDESGADGLAVAQRILLALDNPFRVAGREVLVAASIGVAAAAPGDDAEALLARADQAMYRAKQLGRGRIERYDPLMDRQASRQAELTAALHQAVVDDQFSLVYQPVLDLTEGRIIAREALLRWALPTLGQIPPDEFIPIAEQTGLIRPIGRWVLDEACADCASWQRDGQPAVGVTVNVSVRQLEDHSFVDEVLGSLRRGGLAPRLLTLDVSESRLMAGRPEARNVLQALRSHGVRIAVDDFGTGYSALSWLARLPLDFLKVDQSFVAAVGLLERESAIVQAMIRLAHALGLEVVGEGVETPAQLERLTALGCDLAQGYLLGSPEAVSDHVEPPTPR